MSDESAEDEFPRRGRRLDPRVGGVLVSRGECRRCGQAWIGFASRRAYPGHESDPATLPCPNCGRSGEVSLVLPSPGGIEAHAARRLPESRRPWLEEERRLEGRQADWPHPFKPIGLVTYVLLAAGAAVLAYQVRTRRLALTMVVTALTWSASFAGLQGARWRRFHARHPVVAWVLLAVGGVAAMAVIPGMIFLTDRWGW